MRRKWRIRAKELSMNGKTVRVVAGIAVIVIAIVLLAVLKKDDSGSEADTANGTVPTIVVKNGKPVGGVRELVYNKGDQIHFKVSSDVSDEVHVHGYDLMKDVEAGGTIAFDFPAGIEGVFEAELEGRKEQIVELRVNP
jgi:heme/copper-type cytochrome/quinol oxidase subunit 2